MICQTLLGRGDGPLGQETTFASGSPMLQGRKRAKLFDPYSFVHAACGCLQFLCVPPPWLVRDSAFRFFANLGIHVTFELLENTPWCIDKCRKHTFDHSYRGDTVVNSIGDLFSFTIGYMYTSGIWYVFDAPLWILAVPMSLLCAHALFTTRRRLSLHCSEREDECNGLFR